MKTYNFQGTFPQGSASLDYQRFLLGVEFHESALRCGEERREINGARTAPIVPMIASYAFAAELYLKSLASLGTGKKAMPGHNLRILFARLSADVQAEIAERYRARTRRGRPVMEADVATLADAFKDWRYVFEDDSGRQIHVNLLVVWARSIYSTARAAYPEWTVREDQHERIMAESETPTMTVANLGGGVFVHMVDGTGTLNLPEA